MSEPYEPQLRYDAPIRPLSFTPIKTLTEDDVRRVVREELARVKEEEAARVRTVIKGLSREYRAQDGETSD